MLKLNAYLKEYNDKFSLKSFVLNGSSEQLSICSFYRFFIR